MTALSEMVLNEVNGEDHYGSQPALPPPEDPRPEDMDALLVAELNKLSIIEREHVLQDIHGVSDIVDEEPEFVARCLAELNTEVTMIDNKPAYLQAKAQNPEYVSNLDFRLMFLRADSFIPKLAAIRLVAFFEAKLELFGTEKLTKTILLSDMDKDDIGCLETGYSQLLPGRDRAGRALCTILPMVHNEHTTLRSKVCHVFLTRRPTCQHVVLSSPISGLISAACFLLYSYDRHGGSRNSKAGNRRACL
jgi:hypothetical protein